MLLALTWVRAAVAATLNFPPSDFDILDADGGQLIGHGHYAIAEAGHDLTLRGENRYVTGQYDVEEDKLTSTSDDSVPKLRSFRHDFFNADGSPSIAARLDTETGLGVCGKTEAGELALKSAQFKFPDDTYAGASVLIPVQHMVTHDDGEVLKLHVFNCAPTPKLIAVDLKRSSHPQPWAPYPGALERVDVKANFGFWTVIVQPFIPKLAAWFDPSQQMLLVGAQLQRYYKGEKIILARKREALISTDKIPSPPPGR
jgi:hypothetical protein